MTTNEILTAINHTLDEYRERLDTIPDELFTQTPPDGGWSYAEVYAHTLGANLGSTIAVERCINGTCEPTQKGLTLLGRLFFTLNRFPPVKIKVPAEFAAKQNISKISKEEASNLLIKCRKRLDIIAKMLTESPKTPGRIRHPRFGMLNARQWFRFILIHTRHHIKQLDRIARQLKSAS